MRYLSPSGLFRAGMRLCTFGISFLRKRGRQFWIITGITAFVAVSAYVVFLRPPLHFPVGERIRITEGMTLSEASRELALSDAIRSQTVFKAAVVLIAGDGHVVSGEYAFAEPTSLPVVAYRVARGMYGVEPRRVTVPEGAHIADIAELFEKKLSGFDAEEFIRLANNAQGYLFPETYHVLPDTTPKQVYEMMRETFKQRIQPVEDEIAAFPYSLHEVLTMASILEKEAHTVESRRMIADILWRRLEIGMPLQVDATFLHINGKNTYELTMDDLASDSPYNTYANKGLPPGPIANPGLDSIKAALNPKPNEYLYYLSDKEGNIYYSRTFAQHKQYKRRYLQ